MSATPSPTLGAGEELAAEDLMSFTIEAAGTKVTGTMTVLDGDGATSHLPMMISGLLKQVAASLPELCAARSMTVTAALDPPRRPLSV